MPLGAVTSKIKMMNVSFLRFCLLLLSSVSLLACNQIKLPYQDVQLSSAEEPSCGFVQNSAGARVSWKGQVPATFYLDQSIPEQYRPAILAAAEDWNRTAGRTFIVISTEIVNSAQWAQDGKNIIYWVTKESVFTNTLQQAKSLLRWSGVNLADVDILINAVNWQFYLTDAKYGNQLHLESLLVHELGHALGLAHQESMKSVMYKSLGGAVVRNVPTASPDLEGIRCEYL